MNSDLLMLSLWQQLELSGTGKKDRILCFTGEKSCEFYLLFGEFVDWEQQSSIMKLLLIILTSVELKIDPHLFFSAMLIIHFKSWCFLYSFNYMNIAVGERNNHSFFSNSLLIPSLDHDGLITNNHSSAESAHSFDQEQ